MIIIIGLCIMASAYFGVKGLEIVSWISVPHIGKYPHSQHSEEYGYDEFFLIG